MWRRSPSAKPGTPARPRRVARSRGVSGGLSTPHAPAGRVDDFGQHLGHGKVERGYPVWLVAGQDAARAAARIGLGRGLSGRRRRARALDQNGGVLP